MSYDIQLYRAEVKQKQLASGDPDFFETESNLLAFTPDQKTHLTNYMVKSGYIIENEDAEIEFSHEDESDVTAMLTDYAIYFSASGMDGIFEIGMTASELTDSGEFAKYDPQNGGWEELD